MPPAERSSPRCALTRCDAEASVPRARILVGVSRACATGCAGRRDDGGQAGWLSAAFVVVCHPANAPRPPAVWSFGVLAHLDTVTGGRGRDHRKGATTAYMGLAWNEMERAWNERLIGQGGDVGGRDAAAAVLWVRLLGTVAVAANDRWLAVNGPRRSAVLAALALQPYDGGSGSGAHTNTSLLYTAPTLQVVNKLRRLESHCRRD
jgi:hypothetical protein